MTPRVRVEQDGSVFRLRKLPLLEVNPEAKWFPLWGMLAFSPLIIIVGVMLAQAIWNGFFAVVAIIVGLEFLQFLIIWPFLRADLYDEERLTIDDDSVVWETISPNPKRRKRRELGQPQDMQFKAVRAKKTTSGKIAFWIDRVTITFLCDSTIQRDEIIGSLEIFMKRFDDRPRGMLVPFRTRSFFNSTEDGFIIELPSTYSRSSFGDKWAAGLLLLFLGGFWWGKIFWGTPNVVRQCIQFWRLFPPEQAIKMISTFFGVWLFLFLSVFLLPLMLLNRSYWTAWKISMDRGNDEVSATRTSLFGQKRVVASVNRASVYRKKKGSFLRILWLPHWFSPEPTWERDALVFDMEGRLFFLPCGSKEEADWLFPLIRTAGMEVIEDNADFRW